MESRILPWDSTVSFNSGRFINAADLLIGKDAETAMRAVGYAQSKHDSDYDRLKKLLATARLADGHRSLRASAAILDAVCGMSLTDEPDIIWEKCGLALEQSRLDRIGLASLLGFNDVFVKVNPSDTFQTVENSYLKIHPLLDLGEITDTDIRCDTLDEYLMQIDGKLLELSNIGGRSVRVTLNAYSFNRNSKKREIDDFLQAAKLGRITCTARDQLLTSFMIGLSEIVNTRGMLLTVETDNIVALFDLYSYLEMNGITPKSVIVTEYCSKLAEFIERFAFSSDTQEPGIAFALNDPRQAAEVIPLGCTLVRTDSAADIQGLAALPRNSDFSTSDSVARKLFL